MSMIKTDWKAYYPDDDETADDADNIKIYYWQKIYDEDCAAKYACEWDYSNRDGWERTGEASFRIVIIDPEGTEHHFKAWHEPTIVYHAEKIDEDEEIE